VTTLVDGLLRKNLLEKSDDPEDSRVKLLKLTADGERLVAQILELRRLLHLKVVEEFPPEQRAQLLNTLSQLRRAMEAVRELFV
jgi:DNA-binding MarR family transcriptional regulator